MFVISRSFINEEIINIRHVLLVADIYWPFIWSCVARNAIRTGNLIKSIPGKRCQGIFAVFGHKLFIIAYNKKVVCWIRIKSIAKWKKYTRNQTDHLELDKIRQVFSIWLAWFQVLRFRGLFFLCVCVFVFVGYLPRLSHKVPPCGF